MATTSIDSETAKAVLRQVEFYFSDSNLPRDKFLTKSINESKDHMVSLPLICSFSRMRSHLGLGPVKPHEISEQTISNVAEVLRGSSFLKLSEDGKHVGRVTELLKPEEVIEQVDVRTIAAEPLAYDIRHENVESFFGQYGKVNSVRLPRHVADRKHFCGTALIEFSTEDDAQKVLKQQLVYDGAELVLKTKKAFDIECESKKAKVESRRPFESYPKDLIIAFKLKRLPKEESTEEVQTTDGNTEGSIEKISDVIENKILEDDSNILEKSKDNTSEYSNVGSDENVVEDAALDTRENEPNDDAKMFENAGLDEGKDDLPREASKLHHSDEIVMREDLKRVFQRFGCVKFVDFRMGEDSGYIRFEQPEAGIKARAATAFAEEGGFIVKKYIAVLEPVSGDAEREYWSLLRGNQEKLREQNNNHGREADLPFRFIELVIPPYRLATRVCSFPLHMSHISTESTEDGCSSHRASILPPRDGSEGGDVRIDDVVVPIDDEDEEEDVDFNPFLIDTSSPEAASSLSSENEDLTDREKTNMFSKSLSESTASKDLRNNDRERVFQTSVSQKKDGEDRDAGKQNKRKTIDQRIPESCIQEISVFKECEKTENLRPGEETSSPGDTATVIVSEQHVTDFSDLGNTDLATMDNHGGNIYTEDAICRRTRARHSLANFSLDELETFLQESEDEMDFHNVNDEEEYQKFLAAVLLGGNDNPSTEAIETVEDDDEDNDADFEIEIEEALESDVEEILPRGDQNVMCNGTNRRPETRQKRKHKTVSCDDQKKLLGQAKIRLRPLLPCMSKPSNNQMATFPSYEWQRALSGNAHFGSSPSSQLGLINGFTSHQIGQLYCLIHEHVQLLIQIYSLCVLEPSRQHVAAEVRGMIMEIVQKREEVLAWRQLPYPDFCFHPPCIHPSVSDDLREMPYMHENGNASFDLSNIQSSNGDNHVMNLHSLNSSQSSSWVPIISDPLLSVLDVSPLSLVRSYMEDISTAVRDYKQRHVEVGSSNSHLEREPLFPLPTLKFVDETNNTFLPSPFDPNQPKKTGTAALIESTRKQSVAPVPKDIVKHVKRFFPLFNSALFPRKPPPSAVAHRVLFTDTEDELLAMGVLEYNTNWNAIQKRFLPPKSQHQIFIRHKNRCSSKAPENSIKAVRRMKTSPLTAEEKAHIHEGLKLFKRDWTLVWKYFVPHRDPTLLPRQWRTALGIQKSYKTDEAGREKRRLYESMRRKRKASTTSWQPRLEKVVNNADVEVNNSPDDLDGDDGSYLHEAFLSEGKPETLDATSHEFRSSSQDKSNLKVGENLPQNGNIVETYWENQQRSGLTPLKYAGGQYRSSCTLFSKSYRRRGSSRQTSVSFNNFTKLVKLAPDLPPVNLPPSVRVLSQASLKNYPFGSFFHGRAEDCALGNPFVAKVGSVSGSSKNSHEGFSHFKKNLLPFSKFSFHGNGVMQCSSESEFSMHPLLFHTHEGVSLPCYPSMPSTKSSVSLGLLSRNQSESMNGFLLNPPQLNGALNQSYPSPLSGVKPSNFSTLDFHPFFQVNDNLKNNLTASSSVSREGTEDLGFDMGLCTPVNEDSTSRGKSDLAKEYLKISGSCGSKQREVESEQSNFPSGSHKDNIPVITCSPNSSELIQTIRIEGTGFGSTSEDEMVQLHSHLKKRVEKDAGEENFHEIVMEQEELSDSDDDVEQHVEFECEEIADSDEELECYPYSQECQVTSTLRNPEGDTKTDSQVREESNDFHSEFYVNKDYQFRSRFTTDDRAKCTSNLNQKPSLLDSVSLSSCHSNTQEEGQEQNQNRHSTRSSSSRLGKKSTKENQCDDSIRRSRKGPLITSQSCITTNTELCSKI